MYGDLRMTSTTFTPPAAAPHHDYPLQCVGLFFELYFLGASLIMAVIYYWSRVHPGAQGVPNPNQARRRCDVLPQSSRKLSSWQYGCWRGMYDAES